MGQKVKLIGLLLLLIVIALPNFAQAQFANPQETLKQ